MKTVRLITGLVLSSVACAVTATAAVAAAPAPFNSCNSADLPAAALTPATNTMIMDGQSHHIGWELNLAKSNSAGGLANSNTDVSFRTVAHPLAPYPQTGTHYYFNTSTGSLAPNKQVQYWEANALSWFYTAGSSDLAKATIPGGSSTYPLFVPKCTGDAALRLPNNRGLYLHELIAMLISQPDPTPATTDDPPCTAWNWTCAVQRMRKPVGTDPNFTRWDVVDYWVQLADALNKKVIWSEPAEGWQVLANDSVASSYFAQWGNTLVPMFASNFDTPTSRRIMGTSRQAATLVSQKYGMPLGESVQSWYFREQPDLGWQTSIGLPTANTSGTGLSPTPGNCCNLDPINTNRYLINGGYWAHWGVMPNAGIAPNKEPSLNPTSAATVELSKFGRAAGATYFQYEGTDGTYDVAGQSTYGPVNDMSWAPDPAGNSTYLQGAKAFSEQHLAGGSSGIGVAALRPLYQLWNAALISHYYTTRADSSGTPLDPSGNPAPQCTSSNTSIYCYQEIAGTVAKGAGAGDVPLRAFRTARGNDWVYYYSTSSTAPSGYSVATNVSSSGNGVVGYVGATQRPGLQPLYSMRSQSTAPDLFMTIDAGWQRANALASWIGYQDKGIAAWVYTYDGNFPGSEQYGGSDGVVGTAAERTALETALENADDATYKSILGSLSPQDAATARAFDACQDAPALAQCNDPADGSPVEGETEDAAELAGLPPGSGWTATSPVRNVQTHDSTCQSARCWTTIRKSPGSWAVGNVRLMMAPGLPWDTDLQVDSKVTIRQSQSSYAYGTLSWTGTCGWVSGALLSSLQGTDTTSCPAAPTLPPKDFQSAPFNGTDSNGREYRNRSTMARHKVRGNNCQYTNGRFSAYGLTCNHGTAIRLAGPAVECANAYTDVTNGATRATCRSQDVIKTLNSTSEWSGYCVDWRFVTRDRNWVMVRDTHRNIKRGGWVFIPLTSFNPNRTKWPLFMERSTCAGEGWN